LASTLRIKNSDRASFERKEISLKAEITKLKEEIEKQRKNASETRTEQRSVRSVSRSCSFSFSLSFASLIFVSVHITGPSSISS